MQLASKRFFCRRRHFAATDAWHVRCLTRTPASAQAKALTDLGCEVVQADLADKESLCPSVCRSPCHLPEYRLRAPYLASLFGDATQQERTDWIRYRGGALQERHPCCYEDADSEHLVYSAFAPMKRVSRGKYSQSTHLGDQGFRRRIYRDGAARASQEDILLLP